MFVTHRDAALSTPPVEPERAAVRDRADRDPPVAVPREEPVAMSVAHQDGVP